MAKPSDRNREYMYEMWGTTKLVTDYVQKPEKRHNFKIQNELHEKIRNDDDYDDWEYGTEPIFSSCDGKKPL